MPIQKVQPAAPAVPPGISYASLDPSTFTESGFLDDVDITVTDIAWVEWDYNKQKRDATGAPQNYIPFGKEATWFPFLQVMMHGPDGKDHDQFFKCGSLENFKPSADGEHIELVPDPSTGAPRKRGIPSSSSAGIFLASLVAAGYPSNRLSAEPIGTLKGLSCHIHQEVQKDRKPMPGQAADKENKVMVVDKIHKLPWEAANGAAAVPVGVRRAAPAAASAVAASTPAPGIAGPIAAAAGADDALYNHTTEIILGILAVNGGSVAKGQLTPLLFKAVPDTDAEKGAMISLAFNDAFLGTGRPWKYAGGVLSLG